MASGMYRSLRLRRLFALLAPLALAACGAKATSDENLDSLDAELSDSKAASQPGKDPALMSALQSQIMVDPALAQQANADAVRPPDQPYSAQVPADGIAGPNPQAPPAQTGPLMRTPAAKGDCPGCEAARQSVTLGGLAARQPDRRTRDCVGGLRYSAGWAARMPGDVPIYPQARLIEAAGNAANGCALRAASFTTDADLQTVLDWYFTRTTGAGYASEHQADGDEHVLGGNRNHDGAAYILYATPRDGGGTEIDLIANNGG
ncbi:MAG: hypothetical protein V4659_11655 [Pseudomonadota bacterium]